MSQLLFFMVVWNAGVQISASWISAGWCIYIKKSKPSSGHFFLVSRVRHLNFWKQSYLGIFRITFEKFTYHAPTWLFKWGGIMPPPIVSWKKYPPSNRVKQLGFSPNFKGSFFNNYEVDILFPRNKLLSSLQSGTSNILKDNHRLCTLLTIVECWNLAHKLMNTSDVFIFYLCTS